MPFKKLTAILLVCKRTLINYDRKRMWQNIDKKLKGTNMKIHQRLWWGQQFRGWYVYHQKLHMSFWRQTHFNTFFYRCLAINSSFLTTFIFIRYSKCVKTRGILEVKILKLVFTMYLLLNITKKHCIWHKNNIPVILMINKCSLNNPYIQLLNMFGISKTPLKFIWIFYINKLKIKILKFYL